MSAITAAEALTTVTKYRIAITRLSGLASAIAMARARRVFLFICRTSLLSDTTIQQKNLLVKPYLGSAFEHVIETGWRTLLKNS
jgi:hypothetical protein